VYGALQAVQPLNARLKGLNIAGSETEQVVARQSRAVLTLLHAFDNYANDNSFPLRKLRAACHLTRPEETALRQLVQNIKRDRDDAAAHATQTRQAYAEAAAHVAADVARYGLRTCALPECGATEPHPKAFKLCARCRSAAYCSAAHQQQDWRRHTRDDSDGGCKKTDA
jgi:hypothetical protein